MPRTLLAALLALVLSTRCAEPPPDPSCMEACEADDEVPLSRCPAICQ